MRDGQRKSRTRLTLAACSGDFLSEWSTVHPVFDFAHHFFFTTQESVRPKWTATVIHYRFTTPNNNKGKLVYVFLDQSEGGDDAHIIYVMDKQQGNLNPGKIKPV